jgi:soluble lytic murein transglycosylase-like protein
VSLAVVLSRINEIQTQLGVAPKAATNQTSATQFAAELQAAQATGDGSTGGATGDAVVAAAKKYVGVPYVFGGTNPATGLDCSGLVQRAYKDLGIELPRIAADQARQGTAVPSLAQAKPGDLLAFNSPVDHIAIYVGNGKMIAAPQPGENVKIQSVYQTPSAIRRIIPDAPAVSTAAVVRPASLQGTGGLSGVPYGDLFVKAGQKYGVSAKLLAAVAKVESNYNPKAVSPAGAQGLMQIMPSTAAGLGVNALDPAQAVDGAARLLSRNLKEFGSVPLALAAYNAGGGAVHRYGGIPPFAETQAYVPKVQAALAALS